MASRKGLEFSINVLVIFVLALLVVVALISFYNNTARKGSSDLGCKADFQAACNEFLSADGCTKSVDIRQYMSDREVQCGVGSMNYELAKSVCCQ